MEEEFGTDVQYSPASTIASAIGYQVLSIMGSHVRDALSFASTAITNPKSSAEAQITTTATMPASKERRWLRRSNGTNEVTNTTDNLQIYTLEEVSFHDTPYDCWMVIYDRVYDVTDFINEHPGGDEMMLEYAGRDGTLAFRSVGHSNMAETALKPYLIGILPENERIWTRFLNMNADTPS